jgi:glutathione synthase/RimK-type ligase-like ATP-grasp enzyme
MKIGIHKRRGSFSEHWINYCEKNYINFKVIDCYSNTIIREVEDCDIILWHFHHGIFEDNLFAQKLLNALEVSGKIVFPNFNTAFHFDDKIAQKYLLESINAPLVKSYVFYDKHKALKWVENKELPIVFKLRGGAGSSNVKLIKSHNKARAIIKKSFNKGHSQFDKLGYLKSQINKFRNNTISFKSLLKAPLRAIIGTKFSKLQPREKGYVYFQKFIKGNDSDFRVIIIGDKAIAIKRMVLKNDFRASGSGKFYYDVNLFDIEIIKIAFNVSQTIKANCCAFDFVYDNATPLIVEISFGFANSGYDACPGYWDNNLKFHKEEVNPYKWIIEDTIKMTNN